MLTENRILSDIYKIAVLRANAIGDYIFTLPALEALRAAYPQAEVVLLGAPWHADFLANRPGPVDRVVVVPPGAGVRQEPGGEDAAELDRFLAAMQSERFDLALQLHGGGRHSNPFVLRLGARATAGLKTPDAPSLDRWVPYIYFQPEILRFLEVVGLVGAETSKLEPRLTVTDQDLQEARHVVPEGDRRLVALHPGVGDPRRQWPPEKFAAVGDALTGAGAHVLVTGTQREERVVDAVLEAMQYPAQSLCNRLSLSGLAGLLSRCDLLVSNDSGPRHLAAAVGAATVGIYWCGNLINADPITRSRHRPVLSWRLECPWCGANCIHVDCGHRVSFVADVPLEEVIEAALDLFQSR